MANKAGVAYSSLKMTKCLLSIGYRNDVAAATATILNKLNTVVVAANSREARSDGIVSIATAAFFIAYAVARLV